MVDFFWALRPASTNKLATKSHTLTDSGWITKPYDTIATWEVACRRPSPTTVDDLWDCLEPLFESANNCIWLRGEPTRPLEVGDRCNRRKEADASNADPPDWAEHWTGRRTLCIDIDGADKGWSAPDWFAADPRPERLRELALWARERLPEPFRRAACVYQYSSSMGVKGWADVKAHFWFLSDRPAPDEALRAWFHGLNQRSAFKVDEALYSANQVHYTAAPKFTNADDPLGAHRCGRLDGDPVATLPDDVQTRERLESVRRESERERERRLAELKSSGATIPDGAGRTALQNALERLGRATVGDRHATMRSAVFRVWRYVNAGLVDDAVAVDALADVWRRIKPDGANDLERAIAGARLRAQPVDIVDAMSEPNTVAAERVKVLPTFETVDELRVWQNAEMRRAARRPGIHVFSVSPGAGKSTTALDIANEFVDAGESVSYWTATKGLRARKADELRARLEQSSVAGGDHLVGELRTRGADVCAQWDDYVVHDRARPRGGASYCAGCERNPYNSSWDMACDFYRQWGGERDRAARMAVFGTHHMAAITARDRAEHVNVAWVAWDAETVDGAMVVPYVDPSRVIESIVPVVDGTGIDLSTLSDGYRSRAAEREEVRRIREHETGDDRPRVPGVTDDDRDELLGLIADWLFCSPDPIDIASTLNDLGMVHRRAVAFIDEDAFNAMATTEVGDVRDLLDMFLMGEAWGPMSKRLMDMMTETATNPTLTYSSDDLNRELGDGLSFVERGLYKAKERHWRLLDALRDVAALSWSGAYVKGGVISVPYVRRVDWSRLGRSVVVLDGSATADNVRALYGREAVLHVATVAARVEAVRVDISTGKGYVVDGAGPPERPARAIRAGLERWGGPGAVLFSHKSWIQHIQAGDTDIDYYGSATSRGSNAYVGHHTALMCEFFVGAQGIEQRARVYAALTGDDWTETGEHWRAVARIDLERATFAQAVHRIRPTLASPDEPKRVIYFGRRPLWEVWPEYTGDDNVVDADELVAEVTGDVRRRGGALVFARMVVAAGGGVWAPIKPANFEETRINTALGRGHMSKSHNLKGVSHVTAAPASIYAGQTHFEGSLTAYAEAAGLVATSVANSEGGDVVFWSSSALTADDVRGYLGRLNDHGWHWFEVGADRYWTDVGDAERADLEAALAVLPAGLSARAQDAIIGDRLGVSARTVRDMLRRHGLSRPKRVIVIPQHRWRDYRPEPKPERLHHWWGEFVDNVVDAGVLITEPVSGDYPDDGRAFDTIGDDRGMLHVSRIWVVNEWSLHDWHAECAQRRLDGCYDMPDLSEYAREQSWAWSSDVRGMGGSEIWRALKHQRPDVVGWIGASGYFNAADDFDAAEAGAWAPMPTGLEGEALASARGWPACLGRAIERSRAQAMLNDIPSNHLGWSMRTTWESWGGDARDLEAALRLPSTSRRPRVCTARAKAAVA